MRVNLIKPKDPLNPSLWNIFLPRNPARLTRLLKQFAQGHDLSKIDPGIESYEEISGFGIRVKYKGHAILAGKVNLLNSKSIDFDPATEPGSVTYLAVDNVYKGYIILNGYFA
jgi:cation transport ATPase